MIYADYVAGLAFRWIQPGSRMPRGYNPAARLLARLNFHFEISNTRLAADEAAMRARLRELCLIPKMSTFAIGALINRAVGQMPEGQAFVNIGVWNGFTFLAGIIGNSQQACAGVDNFSEFGGPRQAFLQRFQRYRSPSHDFFDMDYRQYFDKVHSRPIGVYIYDGEHSYANQAQGLSVAERFFARDCLILVDDTNTQAARQATLDFVAQSPCPYKILLDCGTRNNCHPTFWDGLMVLQRVG
jgi:hypothetical protein